VENREKLELRTRAGA